ncbi:OST-HTH/LOTUS domain-containing protein [Shewanella acanthi]|uniref:OST-HTH/LOTUS domain-containing protein n=1 Tax=Shewanella acanthi TaxID=2864212 RepID=UPI001C65E509|nr:OST-HTH/LOTUS domain-containing protein [Shewanella acanthi]QYJ79855.1 OST-HTH/LOTUS domain-containing protein [Shewanella acanthi]
MGQLVNQYVEIIQPEAEDKTSEHIVLKDVFISIKLTIETSSIEYEQCKKALSHMVEQRNEMIHHLLPNFDNRSIESCVELIKKLDNLTEELRKQIATINHQIIGMKKAYRESVIFLTSDNGKYQLELLFIRNSEIITHLIQYLVMSKRSDGWAPLSEAAQFIKNQIPDELCKIREKLGFKSLKCLMLASELFEFKTETTKKGGARVLFRQSDNVNLKD